MTDTESSSVTSSGGASPLERGIAPSEALTRFAPPEGFVPTMVESVSTRLRYGFRTAGLGLLIRQGVGSEVVPMMPIATIPNSPIWLLGMINLRGNLVPVCDLRLVIGEESEASQEKPMILVLDKGEQTVGFLIDGYPIALTALRPANQLPGLPQLLEKHVQTMIATNEEVWLEFDHEGFLEGASQ